MAAANLAGRRVRDSGGGLPEDDQLRLRNLARYRLAVADWEERVTTAVEDERGEPDLRQALPPARCAVEL